MLAYARNFCALCSLLCLLVLASGCRSLIYHPTQESDAAVRRLAARPGWQLDRFEVAPRVWLVGLTRAARAADRPWLVFFGGNAMELATSQEILLRIADAHDLGLAVWAYRGYDGSDGEPKEEHLTADARRQIERLARIFDVDVSRVVLIGQSLGTGIAAHLAAQLALEDRPPAALVLVSPYTSMAQVLDDHVPLFPIGWAVADPYRTCDLIDHVRGPVLIVHGDADTLIAPAHAQKLAQRLGSRATLILLEGRGHNDLWSDPAAAAAIRSFVLR